ncbi:MAG: DUF4301 family protein [Candidatus Eisenbacteria bacterium]
MTALPTLTAQDLTQLAERGITPAEAERQLAVLARPAAWAALVRPCTPGDGLEVLSPAQIDELLAAHTRAAARGRVSAFVPASGAATRMFKDLLTARDLPGDLPPAAVRAAGDEASRALVRFADELPRFAFARALGHVLAARGHDLERVRTHGPWRVLLEGFLEPSGLDAARAPKGQLLFHRDGDAARTAFEEHLIEAVALTSGEDRVRRLDVTVSPEHRAGFERLVRDRVPALASLHGGTWQVVFSEQHPATDTLAAAPEGGPFRDERGRLLFRPAGHGALLRNLAESGRDLVFLKNIDNVAVRRLKAETGRWSRVLVGLAAELSDAIAAHVRGLRAGEPGAAERACAFAARELGLALRPDERAEALASALDRPVRVCGMVANTGEPGGGPFWVQGGTGVTRQIVESAQVDPGSPAQQAVLRAATHFNPVFIACALRDADGRAHDLARFVDDAAVIVTRKSHGGRELMALERPGLWNGAMAHWHTRFVEVPLAVFNPVKTVFDLLRPEHQGHS